MKAQKITYSWNKLKILSKIGRKRQNSIFMTKNHTKLNYKKNNGLNYLLSIFRSKTVSRAAISDLRSSILKTLEYGK